METEEKVCLCYVHRSLPEVHTIKCLGHGEGCPCTEDIEKEKNEKEKESV